MTSYLDRTTPDPRDREHLLAVAKGIVPETCVLPGALVLGYHETGEDPCPDCPIDRGICKGRPRKDTATPKPTERTGGLEQGDDAARRKATRTHWLRTFQKDPPPADEPEADPTYWAHLERPRGEGGKFLKTTPKTRGADIAPLGTPKPVDQPAPTNDAGESSDG